MIYWLLGMGEGGRATNGLGLPMWVQELLHLAVVLASTVGVLVVLYGVLHGAVMFFRAEWAAYRRGRVDDMRLRLRTSLGYFLLLGLEFLIAADILETLRSPGLQEMLVLFGVVIIRTIISFSLHWELQQDRAHENP